jgi:hypothetical protein
MKNIYLWDKRSGENRLSSEISPQNIMVLNPCNLQNTAVYMVHTLQGFSKISFSDQHGTETQVSLKT